MLMKIPTLRKETDSVDGVLLCIVIQTDLRSMYLSSAMTLSMQQKERDSRN